MSAPFYTEPTRRWMVVDDEETYLQIMVLVLECLGGAEVRGFTSPRAALEALAEAPGEFELIVTDRRMPEIDGLEFAQLIRAWVPDAKVILATADCSGLSDELARRLGLSAVLAKPFKPGALETAVRAALAERAGDGYAARNSTLACAA